MSWVVSSQTNVLNTVKLLNIICCVGLRETLEAEVRSKFQTNRRMNDATQGDTVEVSWCYNDHYDWVIYSFFTLLATDSHLASTSVGSNYFLFDIWYNQVPFDETIVKYYWVSERVFEIVDIELRAKNKTLLIEKALLSTEDGVNVEQVAAKLAEQVEIEEGAEGSVLYEEEF